MAKESTALQLDEIQITVQLQPLVEVCPLLSALLVWDWHLYFKVSQFPFNSNVLLHTKWHYSPNYRFQQACFAPFCCLFACSSKFSKPKVVFLRVQQVAELQNSAQNAIKVDILRSKIIPLPVGRGHRFPPYPLGGRLRRLDPRAYDARTLQILDPWCDDTLTPLMFGM